MDHPESSLSFVYSAIVVLSIICSASTAVVWNHWSYVLDACTEVNCGCILFGLSTPSVFTGGHVAYCQWTIYGLLIPMVIALIFAGYHIFRVCFIDIGPRRETKRITQRSGEMIVMTSRSDIPDESSTIPYYWTPAAIITGFFIIYSLIHSIIYTVGFYRTCNQFRNQALKDKNAFSNEIELIQGRLACNAIFDLMDFVHKDFSYERRREGRINTAAALIIALIASWACVFLWIWTTIINIRQSRLNRTVRA